MQGVVTSHSRWRQWIWSVGFVLTLAAVSLLLVQAYRTARRADALREFLDRTSRVLSGVQQLETLAARMEADQRGFLISGTDRLERAREDEYREILRVLADLRGLVHDDPAQSRRLAAAGHALRLRHERMLATSAIAKARGTAAARAIFNPFGERGFEPVRHTLAVLRASEQQQLSRFTSAAGARTRHFNGAIAWGSVLALGLLLASGYVLWRQMRQGELLRESLARAAALKRAVLDSAGLMVVATDPHGTITLFNRAAREALGYESVDLVGRSDPRIFHVDAELRARARALSAQLGTPVAPGFEALVAMARRGGTDTRRWTHVRRDGSTFRVEQAVSAVRGNDGALLGFVAIGQDVTAIEQAHEALVSSEQRVRAIIETASDAFVAIDTGGRVIDWNDQAERMFGWARHEALGQLLSELAIPERYRAAHQAGLARYLATGQGALLNQRIEIAALDRRGREFPIELTIWPTHTATRVSFNAFIEDITERVAAQESIRRLNAELTEQARQLADSNRELEGFSYSVSHDLRAPLRHINGYAQILREDAGDRLDPPLLRYIDEISASARRMGTLIDDLLAFSRLNRQALTPVLVDMNAVVSDAMRDADLGRNPDVRIELAPLPQAHGDPVLLRQVWTNLLSNAVKYSAPRGAQAHVRVEGERGTDTVRYRVRDNGVGFDPRYADKLFGVFQRLHAQDEFEGTGVGLAIVQRIVSRHRGRVSAQSEPGRGAEFTFELPATLPQEADA